MLTDAQLELITHQLGRSPRGLEEIAYQTDAGIPVVLRMRSLVDDKPFPTLYWLSSKDLHRAISRIETNGWVKWIEAELQHDEALQQRFQQNHRAYVEQRWQLMRESDRERIEFLGFTELFNRYGIGGISEWDKVRCLHMHYAHHLCGDNIIGQRMEQEFQLSKLVLQG
jgi:hypothetical protein